MIRALLQKDLAREWRSREGFQAGLVLVGLFFVLFLFTGDGFDDRLAAVALWTPLLYATAVLTGRGLGVEADRGTLEWARTMPGAHLMGWSRTLVDGLAALVLAALTLGLAVVGFGVAWSPDLAIVLLLAVIGLTVMGSLAGGLAAHARARDVLLPILLVPLAAPLLQAGIQATLDALAGTPDRTPLLLMLGYDLVALGVAWLLWPILMEAD